MAFCSEEKWCNAETACVLFSHCDIIYPDPANFLLQRAFETFLFVVPRTNYAIYTSVKWNFSKALLFLANNEYISWHWHVMYFAIIVCDSLLFKNCFKT